MDQWITVKPYAVPVLMSDDSDLSTLDKYMFVFQYTSLAMATRAVHGRVEETGGQTGRSKNSAKHCSSRSKHCSSVGHINSTRFSKP
jgi:hypothetical protein